MAISEARLRELAFEMSGLMGVSAPARKPVVQVVAAPLPAPAVRMDPGMREIRLRIIRHHRKFYGLQVLVDQACVGYGSLDAMPDEAVLQLHKDIDRARECIADGVSLEDAGLIRACA